jgi:sigma-B regulation protein RsbU (phosphoserine phosphatase)
MTMDGLPRLLVCTSQAATLADLRHQLAASGCEVVGHLFGMPDPEDLGGTKIVLVEPGRANDGGLPLCRRLRLRAEDTFLPILHITEAAQMTMRLAAFDAGVDVCLHRPLPPGELLGQVRALLRIKELHDRLSGKAADAQRINRRLQQLHQQLDHELALAQRIQTSFLPQQLPQVPQTRFAVHYLLKARVGGDFYDVFRLDEQHVGLYVADAMGHGVPASLLTIFVKKGVRTKEILGQHYRLLPPEEVLHRLNRDLIEQKLSDTPFITMLYALYNHQDGSLRFARAGHPYPLLIPRHGEVRFLRQTGLLLGVVEAVFPGTSQQLEPGDKVLLYSDGIDSAVFEGQEPGAASLLACAVRHRHLPVADLIDRLARDLFGASAQPDDLTLLGLERV